MAFWRRQKYRLPSFPAGARPLFKQLCEVLPPSDVNELREVVELSVADLQQKSLKNENIDLESAQDLKRVCLFLLDYYSDCPDDKKALIVGAVRYFAVADDAFDETIFASGFRDDKQVINHVLEKLGLEDWYIPDR